MKDSMMKYIWGLFFSIWCCTLSAVAAAQVQAVLEPDTVMEGEPFTLSLSTENGEMPQLQEAPSQFEYQGSSQSTRIVNGQRSVSIGYRFAAPAPGTYRIPPLKVQLGKEVAHTPELTLTVVKSDAANAPGVEDVSAQANFGEKRTDVFVGEEIPLFIHLFYPNSIRLRTAYPEVNAGKSIFRDFRAINPDNPAFAPVRQGRQSLDGKLFERITFQTAFRPLAPGKLQLQADVKCEILIPENRRGRDPFEDFFGRGNFRRIPRSFKLELPELTVKPLPPAPEHGLYLGLVGDYTGEARLSATEVEAQEPLTLSVALRGQGSFETLSAPKLALSECRVYPGEIKKDGNECVIRYAVIPLHAATLPIRLDFLVFDPDSAQYRVIGLDTTLRVKPSTRPAATAQNLVTPPAAVHTSAEASADEPPRTTLLYCKTAPGTPVLRPWWRNRAGWLAVLILAGPLFFILREWYLRHRQRLSSDPAARRRERASEHKNDLYRRLADCPASELPKLATGELTAYLSDRWNLPPGATPETTAEQARDPELAEALRQCGAASYLPPEMAAGALPDPERLRKALLNALKIALLIAAPLGWPLTGAESITTSTPAAVQSVPGRVSSWSEALSAYDRADYAAAAAYFENELKSGGDDPNVLYNLGCIAAAANEPEKALWYFERASLLQPGDSSMLENRNVLRRKFFLPEAGTAATPGELLLMLRDRWRPDNYWLLAGLLWSALWVVLSYRRRLPDTVRWSTLCVLGILAVLAVTAGVSQMRSSYQENQALVVVKNAELYSFPGRHNGRKVGSLPGGTPVEILEMRQEYIHIAGKDLEGWVPSSAIGRLP